MSDLYIRGMDFPTMLAEDKALHEELFSEAVYNNIYPYKVFYGVLPNFEFERVTILYGGNGSGKTTILNVMAEALGIRRHTKFNKTAFFDSYVRLCRVYGVNKSAVMKMITSDDVFNSIFFTRERNEIIDEKREKLFQEYAYYANPYTHIQDEMGNVNYLEHLEKLKSLIQAKNNTGSYYVKTRAEKNIIGKSNGETAIDFFMKELNDRGLYLLDEPENSLSARYQMELASYLSESSRFFGTQLVIATHSPFMLSIPGAKIYNLDTRPVSVTFDWTKLENMKCYYEFFKSFEADFEGR